MSVKGSAEGVKAPEKTGDPSRPVIRIFISSPSDVRPERLIAEEVIKRLDREFGYHFHVVPVLWEREPLVASHHFQDLDNIPAPHTTDVVVVILWARLGMPLPADRFHGAMSGKAPVTGTEWEFEDALKGARETGAPALLVYRKTQPPRAGSLDDEDQLALQLQQRKLVKAFLQHWFQDADSGTFTAAFSEFAEAAAFSDLLEEHLRKLLLQRLEQAGVASPEGGIFWHQNPYRGLASFDPEHAPIFFGRTRARNELREVLARQIETGTAFVLVMGASGSGKSSLVKAGLLPDLTLPGMIGRVGLVRHAIFRPSDGGDDPLAGLAAAILSATALPELAAPPFGDSTESVAALLRAAPEQATRPIRQGLAAAARSAALTEIAEARLLVVVDQMEELFTREALSADARAAFLTALAALARSGLVWVVATLRSDFFDRIATLPALVALSAGEARYLLAPPDASEIGQIIRQPAREAGVRFAVDAAQGTDLAEVVRTAAAADPEALPLLEYALDQLWQRRDDHGVIGFAAYEELGGLEGAIGRRAEAVLAAQPEPVRATFPVLLRALATAGPGARDAITARTVALASLAAGSPARALAEAFLAPDARLLVADDSDGSGARLRVAHEALLRAWPRARDQLAEDRRDLQLRARLEQAAALHEAATVKDRPSLLLPRGLPLSEAEDLLARRRDELAPEVIAFVEASGRAVRAAGQRRLMRLRATAAGFALLAAASGGLAVMTNRQYQRAEQNFSVVLTAADALIFDLALGLRDQEGVSLATVTRILDGAKEALDEVQAASNDDPELLALKAGGLEAIGETLALRGETTEAMARYGEALAIRRRLVARDPANTDWQRLLALSHMDIGDVLATQGDTNGALAAYRETEAIVQRLVAQDPANTDWQNDLAANHSRLGGVLADQGDTNGALAAYLETEAILQRLVAQDPTHTAWQRNLAVSHANIGTARATQGDKNGALAAYREAKAILQRLVAQDPANTDWQRELAVTHMGIGDVLTAQGSKNGALAAYREAKGIMQRLVAKDPANTDWQRLLALSHMDIGDVLEKQGDKNRALAAYREAEAILRSLVARDPANTSWQASLSFCASRIAKLR